LSLDCFAQLNCTTGSISPWHISNWVSFASEVGENVYKTTYYCQREIYRQGCHWNNQKRTFIRGMYPERTRTPARAFFIWKPVKRDNAPP
jgi:hypothetical protein